MVVIAAVVASYIRLDSQASDDACNDATVRIYATAAGFSPEGLKPAIDDVRHDCAGGFAMIRAAEIIRRTSARRPALAPIAIEVAREGTRLEPENYLSWTTLAATLAPTDPAAARESFDRAKELNPRMQTPAWLESSTPEPR